MKKTTQLFLITLLLCTTSLRAEDNLPPPFEASFKIFRKGAEVGEIHRSLNQLNNGEFNYRSETNSTGLVSLFYKLNILEESHWHLQDQLLQPLDYSYRRIKKKKERHKETVFDWSKNQAYSVDNGKKSTLDLKPGMTDKLLYQIDIMRSLELGRHPTTYTVIDGTKIKTYHFETIGEESLDTPIGQFNTVKLVRQNAGEKEKSILWCAIALHYLPIKVENTDEDGSVTTVMINQLSGLTQPQEIYSSTELSE
jgi:hypothetical protein